MSTKLKLYSQQPNGVTYVDPAKPSYVMRFKTNSSPKNLDGQRVSNYVTEIIVNDVNDITVGGKIIPEALSVRLKVSGSDVSHDRLKAMVASLAGQLTTWNTEDVLLGFQPESAPDVII